MATTTELKTATAEELQAMVLASDTGSCAAVLPYWPIWAAAQFASTDEAKQLLQFVHVWRDGDAFQIESTDGHRAFRFRLPAWTTERAGAGTAYLPTLWRIPEGGLLLHAKPLRKAVSTGKLLAVTEDLRAVFHGGKKQALLELSSVNLSGVYGVNTASEGYTVGTYPKINQLWPDSFTNQPGKQFAFNARYLKEWCSVVEKLSERGIAKTVCNSPTTPFVFSCNYQRCIGQHFTDAALEMVLMPVQIRD